MIVNYEINIAAGGEGGSIGVQAAEDDWWRREGGEGEEGEQ